MLEQILYTACVTPFDGSGSKVDYQSLENLLRMQEKAGNGVVLFGSTGEGLSLNDSEKKEILKFVCNLGLKIEIIIGVPSYNLDSALEFIEFCNKFPIQGYLMTTPIYTKPGIDGQTKWFEKLLNKAAYPAILYNIPGRAGVKLHPEAVKNLQKHNRFVAIKDCGGTVDSIIEYKIAAPDIRIYCGDDYMMHATATEGAEGLISIASNAWPDATRKYVKHCCDGKKLKDKTWWQAGKALFFASNPIPIKALLKDIGVISYDTVRLPLSIDDLPSRQDLLHYHKMISSGEGGC